MERELAENPEIVISHNNPPRKGKKRMKRRKGHSRRRRGGRRKKALNMKLRVRYKGKLRTYKSLTKLKGRKFAKKKFRTSRKYHGRKIIGCPRVKHSTKRRTKSYKKRGRRKGRKGGRRKMAGAVRKQASLMKAVWRHGSQTRAALMRMPPKRRFKAAAQMVKRMKHAA